MKKNKYTIDASIYIYGDGLEPDVITKTLGVNPSRTRRKGERRVAATNDEIAARTGVWCLESGSDSGQISDHITKLLSTIPAGKGSIGELNGVDSAHIDIFVSFRTDKDGIGTCEFEFSKENVADIGRVGLPVRVKICVGKE